MIEGGTASSLMGDAGLLLLQWRTSRPAGIADRLFEVVQGNLHHPAREMHAIEQVEAERRARGRGRYSLWTGDIGVALYLAGCLGGDSRFPTLDVF